MNMFAKLATVAAVAGAMAVPMASPSQAAWHHHGDRGTAAAIGFGAGALVGAAAANAAYGPDYYGADYGYDSYAYAPGPGYAYAPGPGYGYAPTAGYAYAPGPGYATSYEDGNDASYCQQRFRSYDPRSGTYMGYDGLRHSCP